MVTYRYHKFLVEVRNYAALDCVTRAEFGIYLRPSINIIKMGTVKTLTATIGNEVFKNMI